MKSADVLYIIGPKENVDSGRIGGVTVPFDEFIKWSQGYCSAIGLKMVAHGLTGGNFVAILFSYLVAVGLVLNPTKRGVFIFHLTWRAMIFLSVPIFFGAKVFSKKVYIRKFAGDFDKKYESASFLVRLLLRLGCGGCRCVFFETEYLVRWARKNNFNCDWWPNSRTLDDSVSLRRVDLDDVLERAPQKIIFLGRISRGKGVDKLIELATRCNGDFQIAVFGPVDDESLLEKMAIQPGSPIFYGGVLDRQGVKACLTSADVLILPTTYTSEGYPGVIIEAADAGLPSIVSSSSRGPAELVEKIGFGWIADFNDLDSVVALLQQVRNRRLNPEEIRHGVKKFDSCLVFEKIYTQIFEGNVC